MGLNQSKESANLTDRGTWFLRAGAKTAMARWLFGSAMRARDAEGAGIWGSEGSSSGTNKEDISHGTVGEACHGTYKPSTGSCSVFWNIQVANIETQKWVRWAVSKIDVCFYLKAYGDCIFNPTVEDLEPNRVYKGCLTPSGKVLCSSLPACRHLWKSCLPSPAPDLPFICIQCEAIL